MKSARFFRLMMVLILLLTSAANAVSPALARSMPEQPESAALLPALPAADLVLYADALAPGWEDWSWDSTVAFDNAAPTLSGPASIAVTFNAAFAGFSLRTAPALQAGEFSAISFFVYAPGTDRALSLVVQSSDDSGEGPSFDFNAPADQWSQIVVGLDSLGSLTEIARVNIGENSGAPQAVFYLDQISLLSTAGGANADIPAVIPGAPKPTISVDPAHGYAGQVVQVEGVAPAGFGGVRLAWLFDGATFNAGEATTDNAGAYSASLEVPAGAPEGAAKVCAAVTGVAQAVFGCADFTIDPPAPGKVNGQAEASLIDPSQAAEVQLLNQAGDELYSALLSSTGAFTLAGVQPGLYDVAVVGKLARPAVPEQVLVSSAVDVGLSISAILSGAELDPVSGKYCTSKDSQASIASLRAQYTDRGLSVIAAASVQSAEGADSFGSAYAAGHMNSILKSLIRKDFGTYLNGVVLNNTFTASVQNISGTVQRVEFHIQLPNGDLIPLNSDLQAPYEVSHNMGDLPPGTSSLIAAAVVNGVRQCPKIREITVAANPMTSLHYQPGAYANWDGGAQVYRLGGTLPNLGGLLPLTFPSQPTSLPLIGNIQSKLGAGLMLSGILHLDGVMQVEIMSVGAQAVLLGLPVFNQTQAVNPPKDGRFYAGTDLRDFDNLAIPIGPRTLWEDRYDQTVFNSIIFTYFGIVTVGVSIKIGVGGELILDATIYPLAPQADLTLTPVMSAYLSIGVWVNVLILASAGVDAIPSVHLGLPFHINTWDGRGAWFDDPCYGIRVDLKAWAKIDYFFDEWSTEATFNLFKDDEPDGCLFAAQLVAQLEQQAAANTSIAPPNPRVMASPQVAASFSGRVISVYVEDRTPLAELPSPAVMARFKDLQTGAWLPAVQISDGQHAVNDPAAAFFGFDGEEALVAWAQTDMTSVEEEAADSMDDYLNQLEIYINRWDGQAWSGPQALTDDLQGDGFPALAGDADGVTLAWVRDADGDSATHGDMLIAVRDWSPQTGLGDLQTLTGGPSGLNAQVSIARMEADPGTDTALAWTYDADGSSVTLEDRRLQLAVRGHAADPAEWVLLNPQPLPPRVENPSLTFESGNSYLLRLAFSVHNLEGDGQSAAAMSDNVSIWTAQVDLDINPPAVTAQALLDSAGSQVRGERPRLQTDDLGETLLVFRQFGELGSQGQLGQAAVSQFILDGGKSNFSPPVYLTGGLSQNWQTAAALNPDSGQLELLTVQRPAINPAALQALGAGGNSPEGEASLLSPAALSSAAAQVALLRSLTPEPLAAPLDTPTALTGADTDDPLVSLEYGTDGDPALDPLLDLSQPHAVIGSSVTVTATVRNLGRTDVPAVVRFYRGLPGSGVLVTESVPDLLEVGEVKSVSGSYSVEGGEEPVYAEVVIDPLYAEASSANNTATASLGALPAPQLASVQPSQVFETGLEIAILPSAAQSVSGYRVQRSQVPGGPYELVGETTGNVHYDLGLTLDQTYCYVVQAYDRTGLVSANSQEVCNLVQGKVSSDIYMPLVLMQ